MGLGLALDDFGNGHSSLSYLHRFPFDTIKIPSDFVSMGENKSLGHTQLPIIKAIVNLAQDLDLSVIAEGVETPADIELLRGLNCRLGQGYAFGAAMTAIEFGKHLAAQLSR
jgi:EAL domain-containing protein (putative c-di-GMP-specific phosphodiesterase class I)